MSVMCKALFQLEIHKLWPEKHFPREDPEPKPRFLEDLLMCSLGSKIWVGGHLDSRLGSPQHQRIPWPWVLSVFCIRTLFKRRRFEFGHYGLEFRHLVGCRVWVLTCGSEFSGFRN